MSEKSILGKSELSDVLEILVAGNEQRPLDFPAGYANARRGVISTFDYALFGDSDNFAIERKSLADFVQSVVLAKSWIRELKKIIRAREWGLPVIYVLEFNLEDIPTYDYSLFTSGHVTSQFVVRRVCELIFDYNVHVVPAGNRQMAAWWICGLLKRRKESLRMNSKLNRQAE
jgi:ERCC4-type nuclease